MLEEILPFEIDGRNQLLFIFDRLLCTISYAKDIVHFFNRIKTVWSYEPLPTTEQNFKSLYVFSIFLWFFSWNRAFPHYSISKCRIYQAVTLLYLKKDKILSAPYRKCYAEYKNVQNTHLFQTVSRYPWFTRQSWISGNYSSSTKMNCVFTALFSENCILIGIPPWEINWHNKVLFIFCGFRDNSYDTTFDRANRL